MSRIIRRVKQPGVYFVTTGTWQRRQIFLKPEPAAIFFDHLAGCREKGFFKLHAFVLMPDHLHILITPGETTSLEKAVQMLKGGSAFTIRKSLNYQFPIWHQSFHDRWIRDAVEYATEKRYIEQNPVKNRLVEKAEAYAFGSACGGYVLDPSQFEEEILNVRTSASKAG
jgi:putative transposase